MKKRILTGDTPTGKLHLGHFVGTLENRVKLQDEYETFIILADAHALAGQTQSSTNLNFDRIRENTFQVAMDNLSVGLDPKKVTIFIESEIPEIYELAAIFSMYVSHNRALRNPTIKDEIKMKGMGDQFSLGFVNYPIYQAADILCVKGDLVPVGRDQEAHLEQTREIARTFNMIKPGTFPEPEALVGRVGKLPGTDGNPKMGKSLGNAIYLSDSTEEVEKKVMGMYTDPTRIKATDPGHIEGNPVFIYLDAFGRNEDNEQISKYKELYTKGQVGDIEVKKYLVQILNNFLDPIRTRRAVYEKDPQLVERILKEGTEKARTEAQKTLAEVKKAMKLDYF
jgi:tryptophanyl-tRNA synthetase